MKKKSLNLSVLKIDSFVTSTELSREETLKAKGGMHTCPINDPEFVTTPCNCGTSHFGPRNGGGCVQIR